MSVILSYNYVSGTEPTSGGSTSTITFNGLKVHLIHTII